jgi:septal ring factor EnvC (AmiA/AmiB activator)
VNETLQVPIGEQEHLKEFFKLLSQNGQQQEASEFSSLVTQLNQMEKQYTAVLSELKAVREQLESIQDNGIKATVTKSVSSAQQKVEQAKDQLGHIRTSLSDMVKQTLAAVKQHGISALNKAADFMGIKAALNDMRDNLNASISDTQKSIDRINAVGSELHALNEHGKNLGRALIGKEAAELTQRNEDKGVLAAIAKPLKKSKAMLEGMEKGVTRALQSIDRLEKAAARGKEEKPSVREGLKAAKQQESKEKPPTPSKKHEVSL